ncbi:energy transducer TonB [uncultured Lutibacter sp.]|uniref:energy transducer TonB n=1 Tax=uncultured Lutibacter sp. TaxID=437739 RepID=UPI0026054EE9|nr:energy transducer TonB [uncultured Lutibacter sp.]
MRKKHPKANLENYSKLFAQLALVLSLFVVYLLIQSKTFTNEIALFSGEDRNLIDEDVSLIEFNIEKPKPASNPPKKVILDIIEKVDDNKNIDETLFETVDVDAPVDISKLENVKENDEIDPKDEVFDMVFLEEAPLFPGCKGTKEELKACFSKQINKFISKKFNAGLAEQLGLSPGIQRIHTMFKIDKNGNIIDIQARAPHVKLKEEAIRVINLLPKMKPGKQQGNPVKVRYSMPIVFKVQ